MVAKRKRRIVGHLKKVTLANENLGWTGDNDSCIAIVISSRKCKSNFFSVPPMRPRPGYAF